MKFLKGYLSDELLATLETKLGDELVGQINAKLEGVTINAGDQKFIPKTVFDADKAALKAQISERDEALKKLKESTKDSAELQAKIAELEKASKESKEKYEAEITASKQKYAFDTALAGYKPKNAKALEALIDKARITYADDGKGGFTITGLKEQVEALRKDEGYLFEDGSSTSPNPQNPPSNPKPDTGKLDKYFGL